MFSAENKLIWGLLLPFVYTVLCYTYLVNARKTVRHGSANISDGPNPTNGWKPHFKKTYVGSLNSWYILWVFYFKTTLFFWWHLFVSIWYYFVYLCFLHLLHTLPLSHHTLLSSLKNVYSSFHSLCVIKHSIIYKLTKLVYFSCLYIMLYIYIFDY
jgi:hypothetical protein